MFSMGQLQNFPKLDSFKLYHWFNIKKWVWLGLLCFLYHQPVWFSILNDQGPPKIKIKIKWPRLKNKFEGIVPSKKNWGYCNVFWHFPLISLEFIHYMFFFVVIFITCLIHKYYYNFFCFFYYVIYTEFISSFNND